MRVADATINFTHIQAEHVEIFAILCSFRSNCGQSDGISRYGCVTFGKREAVVTTTMSKSFSYQHRRRFSLQSLPLGTDL